MLTANIHEAKTHLSSLVDQIAKADHLMVKVVPIEPGEAGMAQRPGFMGGTRPTG